MSKLKLSMLFAAGIVTSSLAFAHVDASLLPCQNGEASPNTEAAPTPSPAQAAAASAQREASSPDTSMQDHGSAQPETNLPPLDRSGLGRASVHLQLFQQSTTRFADNGQAKKNSADEKKSAPRSAP